MIGKLKTELANKELELGYFPFHSPSKVVLDLEKSLSILP